MRASVTDALEKDCRYCGQELDVLGDVTTCWKCGTRWYGAGKVSSMVAGSATEPLFSWLEVPEGCLLVTRCASREVARR